VIGTTFLLAAVAAGAQTLEGVDSARLAQEAASARPPAMVSGPEGAWYRKIESVESPEFDGITVAGVLPSPSFDPGRMHVPGPGEREYTRGPLDSPSVYVGLHAGRTEVDAGLKWDHTYDAGASPSGTFAFRVFWRVRDDAGDSWRNPAPGSAQDVYLLPGDDFAMTLRVDAGGRARLDVRGGGQSFATTFPLAGLGAGGRPAPRSFKRVAAIDQFREDRGLRVGNEGRPAIATRARMTGGRWSSVELLAGARRPPLTGALARDARSADETDRYRSIFPSAGLDARGGEGIDVIPPAPTAP
jgi:hypothetical protein